MVRMTVVDTNGIPRTPNFREGTLLAKSGIPDFKLCKYKKCNQYCICLTCKLCTILEPSYLVLTIHKIYILMILNLFFKFK